MCLYVDLLMDAFLLQLTIWVLLNSDHLGYLQTSDIFCVKKGKYFLHNHAVFLEMTLFPASPPQP